ncbi:hypothetical protein KCV03_g8462, partial [Aureobasidium melanogenum]
MKNDPRTLLGKLRPIDVVQLRGCGLEKLLDFRYRYNIPDEILFQYYEGARSLNHANHIPPLPKSRMFREDRTQMNTHETPQQRVLERLQRTSEQATEAAIESRYYKLTLYCQIKNIEEKLYDSGKSTSGVSFRTKALREWINETRCSELQEDDVKSWRDEGEKWKKLCDKFTPGILEVSHEALDASASAEKQSKIRESASKLFKALTQLTVCGPEIRVLEAMVVNEQTKEKENDRAQRSDQEQNIDIEQEDMKLIAEAEQLFSRQIIQREDFIPIIRCEDCKKYYGVIELLDPCWWTQYASCVLVSNRQDSPDSVDDDQESAKRKHPTNDALADLEYDLPRMKRSRLP